MSDETDKVDREESYKNREDDEFDADNDEFGETREDEEGDEEYKTILEAETPVFSELTPDDLNSAYLNAWRELVIVLCAHYARRFPERCLTTVQETDDKPIASTQLARTLYDDDMFFSSWQLPDENDFFTRRNIPTHEEIMSFLVSHSETMARIRNAASDAGIELNIERIRKTFSLHHEEMNLLMPVALAAMDNSVFRAMAFAAGNAVSKKFTASFICELLGFNREKVDKNLELLSDRGQLIRMSLFHPRYRSKSARCD